MKTSKEIKTMAPKEIQSGEMVLVIGRGPAKYIRSTAKAHIVILTWGSQEVIRIRREA